METLQFSINAVLPLALMMALGYGLKATGLVSRRFFEEANRLSFRILLPVMLFDNIYSYGHMGIAFDWKYVGLMAGCIIGLLILLMIFVPLVVKDRKKIGVLIQAVYRSNFLVFGVPLVSNMFGESEVWTTSMLMPITIPIFNVGAVIVLNWYISEDRGWKRIGHTLVEVLKTPLIVAAIVSYLFLWIGIPVPEVLGKVLGNVSSMGSSLALLALGGTLEFSSMRKNMGYITAGVLGKLVLTPLLCLPLALYLGYRGSSVGALLAVFGSPVAISSYSMAVESGNDGELAGQLVVFSTVCSVLTMFVLIYVLKSLSYL